MIKDTQLWDRKRRKKPSIRRESNSRPQQFCHCCATTASDSISWNLGILATKPKHQGQKFQLEVCFKARPLFFSKQERDSILTPISLFVSKVAFALNICDICTRSLSLSHTHIHPPTHSHTHTHTHTIFESEQKLLQQRQRSFFKRHFVPS